MAVPAERHPVLWVDKAAIVSAPAEIDPAGADDILMCLLSIIRQGATVLIVDMHTTMPAPAAWRCAWPSATRQSGTCSASPAPTG
jgi:hypothetical protein